MQRLHSLDTLWVENFDEITLSRTVKEIEANLCFAIFGKNSKWPPFLGRGKFFKNYQEYNAQIPCAAKILTKSLYLARKEIEGNLCFAIFGKIRKFKMAAILGEGKIFGKLQRLHSLDTLWVENFDEIALSRTVKEIEAN